MATLADIRKQYPQYDRVDDQTLSDALYRKFYEPRQVDRREFDARIGLKPYDSALEATGKALQNVPGRLQMGVEGLAQGMREGLIETANDLFTNPERYAGRTERPPQFDELAQFDQKGGGREERLARAEDYWRRYQDPAQRDALGREIGMINAEASVGSQLRRQNIQSQQQQVDVAPGSLEQYISGGIGAVAESAPGLAASIITRSPAPAMMAIGLQSGGMSYAQARDLGLTPQMAGAYAALQSAAEALPEALPLGVLLREGGSMLGRIVKGTAAEVVQESATEALQAFIDKGFISPDMTLNEALTRIKDAGATALVAGPINAVGADLGQRGMGAVTGAAGDAARTSAQAIGGAMRGVQQQIDGSFSAVQMMELTRGKDMAERVRMYADWMQAQRQPKEAEAPAAQPQPVPTVIDRIIGIESGGNPTARNPRSSAGGLGQFTDSTWLSTVRMHAPPQVTQLPEAQILALKTDGSEQGQAFQRQMLEAHTQDNTTALLNAGIDPTDANVYLAHFLGVGGARKALSADPNASVESVMGAKVVEANPFLRGMTIADMQAWATRKMGQPAPQGSSTAPRQAMAETAPGAVAATAQVPQVMQDTQAQQQVAQTPVEVAAPAPRGSMVVEPLPVAETPTPTAPALAASDTAPAPVAATPAATAQQPVSPDAPSPAPKAPPKEKSLVTVTTPTGSKIKARPMVIAVEDLRGASGSLQPRDRSRASSDAQIEDIAINLDPGRLMPGAEADRGAPIVGPDMIVESGNGRVAAIRRAIDAYPERYAAYVKAMQAAGYKINARKKQVVVMMRWSDLTPAERVKFVNDANTSAIARMSATEMATNDARNVTPQMLDLLRTGAGIESGGKFTTAFLNTLPQAERSGLVDANGKLNADGLRRMRNAVFAAAYDAPDIIARVAESTDDNARAITGALSDVAADWAAMRRDIEQAGVDSAYDLTQNLTDALRLLATSRDKAAEQGRPVKALLNEALNQIDAFEGNVDPVTAQIVEAFYSPGFGRAKSKDDIAAFLRGITAEVQSAIQPQLLGDQPSPREVVSGAARRTARQEAEQGEIFAARVGERGAVARAEGQRQSPVREASQQARGADRDYARNADGTFALTGGPAAGYVPLHRITGLPQRPANGQVRGSEGPIDIPDGDTFVRRDIARRKMIQIIGERLYTGKIRGKAKLGFYQMHNSEVRVKHYDDLEIIAHEAAHWLDFDQRFDGRFTTFRETNAAALEPLSYTTDPELINPEGFAEFVRLWSTNYEAVVAAAPKAVKAFEALLKKEGIYKRMVAFQTLAHQWYFQGDFARFRGKSGETQSKADDITDFMMSAPAQLARQQFINRFHAAKVIERRISGTIQDAEYSPYKLFQLSLGAESTHEAIVQFGTPQVQPDGSLDFNGKSLAEVFWPASKHGWKRFELLMEYFKARRGQETMSQGRERLFTEGEIETGLALAKKYPEFPKVFDEFQAFNQRMLDWYVEMDLITPDQREAFLDNNANYVPFHRVIEAVAEGQGVGKAIGRQLRGGEQNTRDIADNIIDTLFSNVRAALVSRAKSRLFDDLSRNQIGSEYAVEIPAGSAPVKVAYDQLKSKFQTILLELGYPVITENGRIVDPDNPIPGAQPVDIGDIDAVFSQFPMLMQFWQYNQKPTTKESLVEGVIIDGELKWFEIKNALLIDMLSGLNGTKTPWGLAPFVAVRSMVTRMITGMPQFMGRNMMRDTMSAAALTESKFTPGKDSLRGMNAFMRTTPAYKRFALNGGLFSSRIEAQNADTRKRAQLDIPASGPFDYLAKTIAAYERVISGFEYGTRVGQYQRAIETGKSPIEAAYQGREISTDFAMTGRYDLWNMVLRTIPFANAGLQGTDRTLRGLLEKDGRMGLRASGTKLAMMTISRFGGVMTAFTILLWMLNQDDERYQALTPDEKARFWWVWPPGHDDPINIPKPYGVGFIFADVPEAILNYVKNRDGADVAKNLGFAFFQHFWFMDYPAVATPFVEAAMNKKFTGAPIVPQNLADAPAPYQFTDATPTIYRKMGEMLGVSPLLAEHYVKGFTGYAEQFMADTTEGFLWDEEAWGPRPFARTLDDPASLSDYVNPLRGPKVDYRTKWTDGYYELRNRARGVASAARMVQTGALRDPDLVRRFSEQKVNQALLSLNTAFARIDRGFSDGNALLMSIKYDPDLTKAEKEQQIEAYYNEKNAALGKFYREADAILKRFEQ